MFWKYPEGKTEGSGAQDLPHAGRILPGEADEEENEIVI
jgi:hypothetical protein